MNFDSMNLYNVDDLTPHPRNKEFFDDMTGERWEDFLESVKTSGVISPITINKEGTIISGHQRVRACKELGIKRIPGVMRDYLNEDEELKDLIETNLKQRVLGNDNPVKLGKCIKELERIHGIRHGGDWSEGASGNGFALITQADIAKELGVTQRTLLNYKKLAEMIPELQEVIEDGTVSPEVARAIAKMLTEEQQLELIGSLEAGKRFTQSKLKNYLQKINDLQNENALLAEGADKEPERIEVVPDDYNQLKRNASAYRQEIDRKDKEYIKVCNERNALQERVKELEGVTKMGLDSENVTDNVYYFCTVCNNFIGNVGGLVWLTDRIADMTEPERKLYTKAIYAFTDWASVIRDNFERSINEQR